MCDGDLTEHPEVSRITRHQAPPLPGGERKLFLISKLQIAHVVRADGIHSPLAQRGSNGGREVFIEVELHGRRARAAGMDRPSAEAATLSAISVSTSCENFV